MMIRLHGCELNFFPLPSYEDPEKIFLRDENITDTVYMYSNHIVPSQFRQLLTVFLCEQWDHCAVWTSLLNWLEKHTYIYSLTYILLIVCMGFVQSVIWLSVSEWVRRWVCWCVAWADHSTEHESRFHWRSCCRLSKQHKSQKVRVVLCVNVRVY